MPKRFMVRYRARKTPEWPPDEATRRQEQRSTTTSARPTASAAYPQATSVSASADNTCDCLEAPRPQFRRLPVCCREIQDRSRLSLCNAKDFGRILQRESKCSWHVPRCSSAKNSKERQMLKYAKGHGAEPDRLESGLQVERKAPYRA